MNALPIQKLTRRGFLRASVRCGVGLGGLSFSSAAWGAGEVNWLDIHAVDVVLPRLPRAFDGFRLAQISDIHIEGGKMRHQFPDIARQISAQGADAIVLTGDYTTFPDNWQEEALVAGFSQLKAPSGVFAVLGNHDQWDSASEIRHGATVARSALQRGGVRELNNEALALERDGQELWLCGVDDWLTGSADLSGIVKTVPAEACAILLAHEPDFADVVSGIKLFDLMLSGHSHGGQIAMPFVGPIHLPRGARKYPRGFYQVGEMKLYTNRGLGVIEIPLRFCARPELTIFTLRAR